MEHRGLIPGTLHWHQHDDSNPVYAGQYCVSTWDGYGFIFHNRDFETRTGLDWPLEGNWKYVGNIGTYLPKDDLVRYRSLLQQNCLVGQFTRCGVKYEVFNYSSRLGTERFIVFTDGRISQRDLTPTEFARWCTVVRFGNVA